MPALLEGAGVHGDQRIHWRKPVGLHLHFAATEGMLGEEELFWHQKKFGPLWALRASYLLHQEGERSLRR